MDKKGKKETQNRSMETTVMPGANPIELFTHSGSINKVSKIPNQYLNKIIQSKMAIGRGFMRRMCELNLQV